METHKYRPILVLVLMAAATAALGAQQASQSNPYAGTSNPPPDDSIVTSSAPQAKPPAGHPVNAQAAAPEANAEPAPAPSQPQAEPAATSVDPSVNFPAEGNDDGVVQVAPDAPAEPVLNERAYASDPDGDIVHPQPLPPGELGKGRRFACACWTSFRPRGAREANLSGPR